LKKIVSITALSGVGAAMSLVDGGTGCAWAVVLQLKAAATAAAVIKDRNGAAKTALTFDVRVTCPIALSSLLRV
jgi:nitrogenase molybdenum-iron protein alpha/beta subunit